MIQQSKDDEIKLLLKVHPEIVLEENRKKMNREQRRAMDKFFKRNPSLATLYGYA